MIVLIKLGRVGEFSEEGGVVASTSVPVDEVDPVNEREHEESEVEFEADRGGAK